MKKILIVVAAALAIPVSAATAQDTTTPSAKELAKTQCKTERAASLTNFRLAWGTNKNGANAFGKCISAAAKTEKANLTEAKTACTAEQGDAGFAAAHGGKTFTEFYGTGKQGKNAYAKCVKSKATAAAKEDAEARINAAKACKKERSDDATAFGETYGTKKNAFGKCVSTKAKAQNDETTTS